MEELNSCEMLREEAHQQERLRTLVDVLLMSESCETLEEFRAKLRERLSK